MGLRSSSESASAKCTNAFKEVEAKQWFASLKFDLDLVSL